ncbi:sulfatase-like hydrolase/transferase [Streptomyces mesophilus]|uniref:sulfatase-like hydrolase/transferase n=1 Tax=Streptomyces mesophilus TaxID=1775132 RepID=UPI003332AF90
MPTRRGFLTAATAVAAGSALSSLGTASAARAATHRRRPNIVLINADDLGYGEFGSYGQELISTPHLDRLAAEGIRFTDAYANAPLCAPSRASLLTGLHGGHATVRENPTDGPYVYFQDSDTSFAEPLRARGYRTAVIGKWGYGDESGDTTAASHPNRRGFEEFYGYISHIHAHEYYPGYLWHNGEKQTLDANLDGRRGAYAVDLFERRALDFIDAHAEEPFLLFLTPSLPHAPGDVPEYGEYEHTAWTKAQKAHAWQITRFDSFVGAVVDRLARLGIDQDTLVLITSDNGPHSETGKNGGAIGALDPRIFDPAGPLRGYKRNLYEGGIRIPLIAYWPGHAAAATVTRPTPQVDLFPTLADLAGAPVPDDLDGLSLAPLLTGAGRQADHASLYWYRNEFDYTALSWEAENGRSLRTAEAVRAGDFKLVRYAPGRDIGVPDAQWTTELFHLAADVGETTNVAAAHPGIVDRLTADARAAYTSSYERTVFGVHPTAPTSAGASETFTVSAVLGNGTHEDWTAVRLRLVVPEGWRVKSVAGGRAGRLAAGESATAEWRVTAPATAVAGASARLRVHGSATDRRGPLGFTVDRTVGVTG